MRTLLKLFYKNDRLSTNKKKMSPISQCDPFYSCKWKMGILLLTLLLLMLLLLFLLLLLLFVLLIFWRKETGDYLCVQCQWIKLDFSYRAIQAEQPTAFDWVLIRAFPFARVDKYIFHRPFHLNILSPWSVFAHATR